MQPIEQSKYLSNSTDSIPDNEFTCAVYTSFEELVPLQEQWDNIVEANGADIFLTFDWCQTWWKYYGHNRLLKIYIFWSNQEMVGLFPLFFERIWFGPVFIDAVKIIGSDHTLAQFYLPINIDFMEPVIYKLFTMLSQENRDVICLGPLTGLYPYTDQLQKAIHKVLDGRYKAMVKNTGEQTLFHLAKSWEEQLNKMNNSDVKDIARSYRRLQKNCDDPTLAVETDICDAEKFAPYFEDFVGMHQDYWHKSGRAGHFEDWPSALEFHRETAQKQLAKKRLKLLKIYTQKCCLGYEYDYWFGGKCYELLAARREEEELAGVSVGKINYCEKMKLLIDNKIGLLDSMRGKYMYKLKLGGHIRDIECIYVISRSIFKRFRIMVFCGLSRLLHVSYYKIWYCRLAQLLPFKRRPLCKLWIRTKFLGDGG